MYCTRTNFKMYFINNYKQLLGGHTVMLEPLIQVHNLTEVVFKT